MKTVRQCLGKRLIPSSYINLPTYESHLDTFFGSKHTDDHKEKLRLIIRLTKTHHPSRQAIGSLFLKTIEQKHP